MYAQVRLFLGRECKRLVSNLIQRFGAYSASVELPRGHHISWVRTEQTNGADAVTHWNRGFSSVTRVAHRRR
jgi:hypothetical protein